MNPLYLTLEDAYEADRLYHPWRYTDAEMVIDEGPESWYEGDDIENLLEAGLTLCGL